MKVPPQHRARTLLACTQRYARMLQQVGNRSALHRACDQAVEANVTALVCSVAVNDHCSLHLGSSTSSAANASETIWPYGMHALWLSPGRIANARLLVKGSGAGHSASCFNPPPTTEPISVSCFNLPPTTEPISVLLQ